MRLAVDHPRAVRQLHAVAHDFDDATRQGVLLQRALDGAITLLGADLGNIQLYDPARHTLTIAAEQGFSREFLEYFAAVTDDSTACGRAAVHGMQTIIFDVNHDPAFAPHRGIASASGFRAVQSTPLVDRRGRLRGILSTHFRRPHRPTSHELQIVDWLAELLTAELSSRHAALALSQGAGSLWPAAVSRADSASMR
jgi:GAF domain-containing protein